jgi:predicted ribosomally synthesized peptide with SipW-like signal peptide
MKNTAIAGIIGLKTKAILAGALVLGLGGAVTLASWNDSEVAAGAFAGGSFALQSSTDGTTFTGTGSAATLAFSTVAKNLSPDTTVYAPFAIQLAAGTTNAATVNVASVGTGTEDFAKRLGYKVAKTASITCDATAFAAGSKVLSGTAAAPSSKDNAIALDKAGTPTYFCIAVTAGKDLPQKATGTLTWTFTSVSTETALVS